MNIEVLSVEKLVSWSSDKLLGNLDLPVVGHSGGPALVYAGWVLPVADSRPKRVSLELDGHAQDSSAVDKPRPDAAEHGRSLGLTVDGEQCGFSGEISLVLLPSPVELTLSVRTWDNERFPLYKIVIEHDGVLEGHAMSPTPIALTTLGRTGSTWISAMLSMHPSILCEAEAEPRVGLYWLSVLHSLSRPRSYLRKYDALDLADPNWWLGGEDLQPGITRSEGATEALLGPLSTTRLAGFVVSELREHYQRVSHIRGKTPQYFLEKYLPNLYPDLLGRLVQGTKEIFLVRDWRDVVASMTSYGRQRQRSTFGVGIDDSLLTAIKVQKRSVELMRLAWNRRKEQALLVRYEDLVRDLEHQLKRILSYLGLEPSSTDWPTIFETMVSRSGAFSEHKTTTTLQASIGRWKTDLTAEEGQLATELFQTSLETFGYDTSSTVISKDLRSDTDSVQ